MTTTSTKTPAIARPASDACRKLQEAIDAKTAVIGVIGLGYVGLPLVRAFVQSGYRTIGFAA